MKKNFTILGIFSLLVMFIFTGCNKSEAEKVISDEELGEIIEDTENGDVDYGEGIGDNTFQYNESNGISKNDLVSDADANIHIGIYEESTEEEDTSDYSPKYTYEKDKEPTKMTFKIIDAEYLDKMSYEEYTSYYNLNVGTWSVDEILEMRQYQNDRVLRDSDFGNKFINAQLQSN